MAHYEKYTKVQLGHVCNHDKRIEGDGIQRSNENIDSSRTYLNYLIGGHKDATEFIKRRLSEVRHLNRDDVVQMCSCIVTVPKDYTGDERDFFHSTYEFLKAVHGEQNIVSAWVHKDEVTPHLHFKFIPIVEDEKNGGEKLCCKEVLTRQYLREFHKRLQEHLEKDLGVPCNILNGATENGNKTVQGLKADSLSKENEKAEKRLSALQSEALQYEGSEKKHFGESQKAFEDRVATSRQAAAVLQRSKEIDKEVEERADKLAWEKASRMVAKRDYEARQKAERERDKAVSEVRRVQSELSQLERELKDEREEKALLKDMCEEFYADMTGTPVSADLLIRERVERLQRVERERAKSKKQGFER